MIVVIHGWVDGHIGSEATRGVDVIFTDWALEPQEAHTYVHLAQPFETIYVYGASETPFSVYTHRPDVTSVDRRDLE